MSTGSPPARGEGSTIRLLIGIVLIVAALVNARSSASCRSIRLLEAGGYGTPAMRGAFVVLGGAGALLAAGIATVIWDISKRYEHK